MFLRIEKGSAVPISRQIADQLATVCASGTLRPDKDSSRNFAYLHGQVDGRMLVA